ncbi:MAG TPA: hypothetical protein VD902_12570 [Symbiobacteriaceae bacterium]|nr:hypothetical protein [Symbiobacteriaceae bacterium]
MATQSAGRRATLLDLQLGLVQLDDEQRSRVVKDVVPILARAAERLNQRAGAERRDAGQPGPVEN